jgi:hypothetical protein
MSNVKFGMERFNFKKPNEVEGKEQYQVKICNRFAALENLNISRAWDAVRENINILIKESVGYYELNQLKL